MNLTSDEIKALRQAYVTYTSGFDGGIDYLEVSNLRVWNNLISLGYMTFLSGVNNRIGISNRGHELMELFLSVEKLESPAETSFGLDDEAIGRLWKSISEAAEAIHENEIALKIAGVPTKKELEYKRSQDDLAEKRKLLRNGKL